MVSELEVMKKKALMCVDIIRVAPAVFLVLAVFPTMQQVFGSQYTELVSGVMKVFLTHHNAVYATAGSGQWLLIVILKLTTHAHQTLICYFGLSQIQ